RLARPVGLLELGDEGIVCPPAAALAGQGAAGGEVAGVGLAGHRDGAVAVHRHAVTNVLVVAAQVAGVVRPAGAGGQLGQEGIAGASLGAALVGQDRNREVGRCRGAGHVNIAVYVHGHGIGLVVAGAAEVRGVNQGSAGRVQLRHKRVLAAAVGGLLGRSAGGVVGGSGAAGDKRIALGVQSDAVGLVVP